jgi:hypothetical protein
MEKKLSSLKLIKKKKVIAPQSQPSAHMSSTSKKNAKIRAAKLKTRKAPIKKPAPAVDSDEEVPDDISAEEPDAINIVTDDDEPVILEVPDVKTDEEDLGL